MSDRSRHNAKGKQRKMRKRHFSKAVSKSQPHFPAFAWM